MSKIAVVLGVGPGIGAAVARRFAKEGFTVALAARTKDKLLALEKEINDAGGKAISVQIDAGNTESIINGFSEIKSRVGNPDVFVYNVGSFKYGSIEKLTTEDYESAWRNNCLGAITASQQVLPHMLSQNKGTIILTGATASMRGSVNFSPFAVGKFGLRAFAQSLAREYYPKGIHVAHVVIDGQVNVSKETTRPLDEMLNPVEIANTYWNLYQQDKTAWTHELELRTNKEKW
ncbi:hypothetical protein SAMD00019534_045270 [Acytostelium subglobosum LB1]|uniref:hypothetical protein n=1 Tax=Acytostelium subglobosum LB1 TaxID=1410327 RepID=UPI000644B6FE|nr:hypothetical protein SAMD00019534_045270 [Acytostelium subglobosum LB1]GAM21352.1 hypothetical protein SAMD00019534_045270 [Acytostelium subglobosum LB1]|eukprot:XP_012755471.1 hypothetical protein SAMD00019534_045270 [Acytostelium subglobosum LB1]